MADIKRNYEMMVMWAPEAVEQKEKPQDIVEALVKRAKGSVMSVDDWGERTLDYKVDGHDKGYYLVYQLELKPESLKGLKQRMGMEKNMLRWLIISK